MRPLDITAIAAFCDEVRTSTPAILAALDAAEQDPANTDAPHEAYRLIHALKGAASMVGLAAFSHVLNAYEELLDGPVSEQRPLPDGLLPLLRAGVPEFVRYMDAALACEPTEGLAAQHIHACAQFAGVEPDEATLIELLDAEQHNCAEHRHRPAAPADPEPAPAVDDEDLLPAEPIPPELAEVFEQEAQEHLQSITRLTTHLSASPDDREAIQELRRAFHTIKGAAGVIGYRAASRVAHRMEDLLDRLYEGTALLTPEVLRLVSASSDALEDSIATAADPDALRATIAKLFAQYDVVARNIPAAAPAIEPGAPPFAPAEPEMVPAAAPPPPAAPEPGAPEVERRRGPDRRKTTHDRRGSAQLVRVPFERLSELVRLVSELVINRSSFDQHFAALVEQVDEVKLSTARLRRVSQKLETDYEVRALAGNMTIAPSPGAAGGHGFDELEFDRYTDFHLLSRELTETASDIATISTRLGETIGNFDGDLTRLGRLTREVQDKVMEFRMVPLASIASRLDRAVRVTAEACAKDVDLVVEGETTALDKRLLEEMSDPLLHLLRNAVDHGIEIPAVRRAVGKAPRGRITVRALHEGTDVLIEVEDDGAGLNVETIRRLAIERGYVTEADAASLAPEDLFPFVFEPGFSTAERISEVSGRGVGLDIVKAKVGQLGGRTSLASQPGGGTTITIRVPMTLAITRVLVVRAGGETLGLPLGAVAQIVRPESTAISLVGSERVLTVDGRTYPLRDLAEALGLPRPVEPVAVQPVLVANLGGRKIALAVDEIVQSRDAVVKTLGTHLRRVQGVWGATLLGDGTVVLILNPVDLAGNAEEVRPRVTAARIAPRVAVERDGYTILIVDDSLSMRHVLSSAVRKAGWNPVQARDGVDALEVIHRAPAPPDAILLDIEMPRMDGYEFLATLRAQDVYRDLPIVMLTSRGGEKHREKAMSLGATGYVVKPFQEKALLQTLGELVGAARGGERKAAS